MLRLPPLPVGGFHIQLVLRFERSAQGLVDALATAEVWRRLRQGGSVKATSHEQVGEAVRAHYLEVYPKLVARGWSGWQTLANTMIDEHFRQLGELFTDDEHFNPYDVQPGETIIFDFVSHFPEANPSSVKS